MAKNKAYTRINKLAGLAPFVLFLTSYMPLFILIIVRQLLSNWDYLSWGGFNMDAIACMIKHFGMSIICCVISIFGFIGTHFVFINLEQKIHNVYTYKITESSNMNDEPLAYIATYIIPIIFEDYSNPIDCITIISIFYIIYKLYIRSKLILVNPILSLKYSIYNIKYLDGNIERQGILISKDYDLLENEQAKMYNIGYQLFYGYKR